MNESLSVQIFSGRSKIMERLLALMALSYLIQTYAINPGIIDLPLSLYLKETLNLSAGELATFQMLGWLPWTIKPLWGVIADSFPLLHYPTKGYFLGCYSLSILTFLGLSQIQSHTSSDLVIGYASVSTCFAFTDVLTDKLMVREGRPKQKTAILQAAQWTASGLGGAVMYYLSGWIAKYLTLSSAFIMSAIVPFAGLVATLFLLKESKVERGAVSVRTSLSLLWTTVRSRQFLAILGFIVLLYLSPTPPLLFYKRDVLNFDEQFLGTLGAVWSLAFGLGAIVFGVIALRLSRRHLLNLIIVSTVAAMLALSLMSNENNAIWIDAFNGLVSAIAMLGVLEIAAIACPVGAEATVFALLLSASNFAASVSILLGGWLYDRGVAFSTLVVISAAFTGLCWFLIPLLKLERA